MEITKREIIFSVIIIAAMLMVGIIISGKISDSTFDRNEQYHKAIHVEDKDLFEYGMRTNVGNAFVYGDLVAIDSVSYPEIDGQYMYIEKVKERYTQHTRTVSYKCGKSKCYRTETYWTWDRVGSEEKQSEKVTFLDVEFDFNQFNRPDDSYLTTVKENSHIRYKYYVVEPKLTGTIFANLKDNTIADKATIYENKTTDQAYNYLVDGEGCLWLFWIVWITLTGGVIYGFYYLENEWLY